MRERDDFLNLSPNTIRVVPARARQNPRRREPRHGETPAERPAYTRDGATHDRSVGSPALNRGISQDYAKSTFR